MKIISKFIFLIFFFVIISISYLSLIGIETDRFNSQITNKIKTIDEDLEIELKKIKLIFDPFKLSLNIKTVGSKIKKKNKVVEIENLKTQISLKSVLSDEFLIKNLEISSKSLEIKNLISFLRTFQNTTQLFLLEKIIEKGYLIADIKIEFDSDGRINNNFIIDGFIKDAKLSILKEYNIQKLDLIFNYQKNDLLLSDISFSLNNLNFLSEKIFLTKKNDDYTIKGNINHKALIFDDQNLNILKKSILSKLDIQRIKFSSNNSFFLKINKKFELIDYEILSDMFVNEFLITNKYDLTNFFPNIKENFTLTDNIISVGYKKNNLDISGKGNILFQDQKDFLEYTIKKKNEIFDFKGTLKINSNHFLINSLNFEKDKKIVSLIQLEGKQKTKKDTVIKKFSYIEGKNKIDMKNLIFNKKFQVIDLETVNLDYTDKDNQKNLVNFYKKKDKFYLKGSNFNANKLIDDLLFNEKEKSKIIDINSTIIVDLDKIQLDNEYDISNFTGKITFFNKEIVKANLIGNFSDNKKLKFTINSDQGKKITTLFVDNAEPIVRKYKFIKGFDEGSLDFNSSKNFDETISQLKIYDFKLKELPVLTKILTLASLQGIADILTGEGIRFDEFEMNFKNKGDLMTIDEIYAIGPAISILMNGYVEKNKLVSLRGTLVPATTVNKFIGSLPVLGKILVGSKTGEGVFGVSFKIKGPPKKLDTTVNPIKTLTPRFITRTLEKIKKN